MPQLRCKGIFRFMCPESDNNDGVCKDTSLQFRRVLRRVYSRCNEVSLQTHIIYPAYRAHGDGILFRLAPRIPPPCTRLLKVGVLQTPAQISEMRSLTPALQTLSALHSASTLFS